MKSPLEALQWQVEAESGEGALLRQNPANNGVCCVTVDWSVPCLVVMWKKYATSLQLRYVHELVLELLQTHRLHKIAGNDQNLPVIAANDRQWITEDWMPRAVKCGLEAAASRVPATLLGKWSVSTVQSKAPENLTIRSFDTMQEAKRWLTEI